MQTEATIRSQREARGRTVGDCVPGGRITRLFAIKKFYDVEGSNILQAVLRSQLRSADMPRN
jgi:hypothetical protein